MNVLITGGCGFIGHHIVEHIIRNTNWNIKIIDKLSYASHGFDRINDINIPIRMKSRIEIFTTDLCSPITPGLAHQLGNIDYIIHLAAETHVDTSVTNPVEVIHNNIMSTLYILEYSRSLTTGSSVKQVDLPGHGSLKSFLYFSTDEVYGPADNGVLYSEKDRHNPSNPYSASKSCGEQLCNSYHVSYGIPITIINVMNVFGERQHTEKFIPKVIKSLMNEEEVYIYTDEDYTIGTRCYIHARNVASAVLHIINNQTSKLEYYNIAGEQRVNNLEMAQFIAKVMGADLKYKLTSDKRIANDLNYGLDGTKLEALGWKPPKGFWESLEKTILWTCASPKWISPN